MGAKRMKWYKVFDSVEEATHAFPDRQVVKVNAGNKYICFTRNNEAFFAFDDRCPHQGMPLTQGKCTEENEIWCPFHQYRFDLKNGRGHGLYLPIYPVEIRENGIFIGFERGFWDFF
jgi:nitrite reductase/ring-hydroxylating ferredoxin subunit